MFKRVITELDNVMRVHHTFSATTPFMINKISGHLLRPLTTTSSSNTLVVK